MPELPHILSEFRAGKLGQVQLLAHAEELLDEGGQNLDSILGKLQEDHTRSPLPLGVFVALRKHLIASAAPKTEILSAPPLPPTKPSTPLVTSSSEDAAAKQAIGATLGGRFRLIEFIGSGGTSRLYKAIDQRKVEAGAEDRHVAVKVLTYPFKDTLEALAVLNRESEGTQKLAHPNIVRVIDCDRDGDTVFMTMEFIGGKTLHALMRTSRFLGSGRTEAWSIIRDIASAVDFAHSKFIVHGDLTPGNVMIAVNGGAKVIDFGIARVFGQPAGSGGVASSRRPSSRGEIAGFSPSYASPETLEFREPDPRDDIYALACITWELLTGARPFGRATSKVARDEGLRPAYNDKLTRKEFAALTRALEFDREKRTATVKQFMEELVANSKRSIWIVATTAVVVLALGSYFFLTRPSHQPLVPATQVEHSEPKQIEKAPEPIAAPLPPAGTPPAAGTVFRDCPTCPLMTVLPAGEFEQGSAANLANAQTFEIPQHHVTIAQPFSASRTEITVGEFAEFAAETKRDAQACTAYDGSWKLRADVNWRNAAVGQTAVHPASCVSWQDATDYAAWLSTRTGQTYRLPSASEWEYAARAGSTSDRPWKTEADACTMGNMADRSAAQRYPGWTIQNCTDANAQAAPVGSFAANSFGLQDMLGNVFEWVADCWSENYAGAPIDGAARHDGDCSQHEMRGGSWFTAPDFVRFAYRNRFASDYRSTSIGFRVVREFSQRGL